MASALYRNLYRDLHLDEGWRGVFLRTDWISPAVIMALCVTGCMVIYSATSASAAAYWSQQAFIFIPLGWVIYWLVAMMDYGAIRRHAPKFYWAVVALLAPLAICAVLKISIGDFIKPVNHARRWIDLGFFKIQPSEFAKVSTLIMVAAALDAMSRGGAGRESGPDGSRSPRWLRWLGVTLEIPVAMAGVTAALFNAAVSLPYFYHRHPKSALPRWRRFCAAPLAWRGAGFAAWAVSLPIVRVSAVAALPIGLIFVQPDLKSCIVYLPMLAVMLFIARFSNRLFLAAGLFALVLGPVLAVDMRGYATHVQRYLETHPESRDPAREAYREDAYENRSFIPRALFKDYQRERILSFVRPDLIDPRGTGSTWNVKQAIIATGRGGLSGTGWNQGSQAKLGYLPELAAHNDFAFSVFAEEFGFVGAASLLAAYAFLTGVALRTAVRARDRFGAYLCVGVAAVLTVHAVVNIGMNIGLMPVSGLPLPFLSYGGSFVLSCFLLLGLVQSVHRHSRELPPRSVSGADISANALQDMRKTAGRPA